MIERSGDETIPKLQNLEPQRKEERLFNESDSTGKPPLTNGENGRRVVKILEYADVSAASNGIPVAYR